MSFITKNTLLISAFVLGFTQNLPAQIRSYDEGTNKRGISDYEGTPIIPAEYDDVSPYFFDNDTFYVATRGDRKGVFYKNGRLTIPFDYQAVEIWAAQSDFQFGLALVNKDRRTGWGIMDARTGAHILPQKFEFVRAIFRDLLVGRQFADSTLQFFNGRGEPLFQSYGRSATPGFDENSIQIRRVDRTEYFVDRKGKPIFPANLKNPRWTDGERVICFENGKMGLVTMSGKTLIPFEWEEMQVQNAGQFLVKNQSGESGLMDSKGQFIIPLSKGGLYLPCGKPGPVYIRSGVGTDPNFNFQLFDATGKLLFSDVRVSLIAMASELSNVSFNRSEDYFSAEMKGKKEQFIFHVKRGQVLPIPWTTVWYGGEKHPLIAVRKDESGHSIEEKVFDLNGKLLFSAPTGMNLQHSRNPRLLLAWIKNRSSLTLLDLNANPEKMILDFSLQGQMYNGCFVFEKDRKKGLLDPNGKILMPANKFISLGSPNKIQVKQFRESQPDHGKLVAVGSYEGVIYPSWVGVNERGESFVFGPPPQAPPKPVEPLNQVMEAPEAPTEVDASKLPVPVMEEMPSKPAADEVQSFVEKMPQFPGTEAAMYKFIAENLRYPPEAKNNGIQGRVILSFIVEKDGSLSDIKIVRDIGGGCGEEAIRVVKLMPKWTSGQQRGKPVRVKYTLPVAFKLVD